jgi:cation-transporting ATPase 13A1
VLLALSNQSLYKNSSNSSEEMCACFSDGNELTPMSDISNETVLVLASCHSLVQMDDALVGDPLEKAALKSIDWSMSKGVSICIMLLVELSVMW